MIIYRFLFQVSEGNVFALKTRRRFDTFQAFWLVTVGLTGSPKLKIPFEENFILPKLRTSTTCKIIAP